MVFLRHSGPLLALALFAGSTQAFAAASPVLDDLAGTWNDLDSFASIGQCIAGPSENTNLLCSPTQLNGVKRGRFEGRGTISATDSVLDVADRLRKEEITASDVNSLFQDYNYSDVLLNVDLDYVGPNFLLGVKPVRYQGQFEVHNPNLPLASLAFRDDRDFHAAVSHGFGGDILRWRVGASAAMLFRNESLVEATVIDLATTTTNGLIDHQKLTGVFGDLGTSLEFRQMIQAAVLMKDLGGWLGGNTDHSSRYLFIRPDKTPKVFYALSATPRVGTGRLQIGVSAVQLPNEASNSLSNQWFGTVSYFVGPFRLLTGFRPNLFRSGLAVRFSRFEANVAQEWINKLEDGRKPQPRFTLEVTSGL
jgi:hypothetical protein